MTLSTTLLGGSRLQWFIHPRGLQLRALTVPGELPCTAQSCIVKITTANTPLPR